MKRTLSTLLSTMMSLKTEHIGWSKLAAAWSPQLVTGGDTATTPKQLPAVERTLPLLTQPGSVPFVCRYRADVIRPLQVAQVHQLADWLAQHQALASLREKVLPHVRDDEALQTRVLTTHSKTELQDLYAPFAPPAAGSLEDRIRQQHPALVTAVDQFFNGRASASPSKLQPHDAAVTLLANRVASHPAVMDALLASQRNKCHIKVQKGKQQPSKKKKKHDDDDDKYAVYYDMERPVVSLRDYQILALRRGADQKALQLTFVIDADRAESTILWALRDKSPRHPLWKQATHDAWTRLLRKRFTTRVWRDKVATADQRSVHVFCDNLYKALLAPPPATPRPLLALDPGFKAGIKCCLLDAHGNVCDQGLATVEFVSNKSKGRKQLEELLKRLKEVDKDSSTPLWVIVGNGHGTQEAQQLVHDAATACRIEVDVKLVNEAGASVWSVEPAAAREFPDQPAAAIAAVSIGRRYLNPLAELVKIPPRSLGLGMYQHDVPEKELDEKLHLTSVDAVAEVGVDVNGGSLEILVKVPGLTTKLVERIIDSRPLPSRQALLKISGLGPKTFENCAAFLRVNEGAEPLDRTLCHPESYDLARYLLKKMKWDLNDPSTLQSLPSRNDRSTVWRDVVDAAARKFDMTNERVLLVFDHLVNSILNPDPRLRDDKDAATVATGTSVKESDFKVLPADLVIHEALRKACPVRDIEAVVRNVLDFGIFVDFGGETDGLLHRSKLGSRELDDFMVGQAIGVDILGVSTTNRVSMSLAGLGYPAESPDDQRKRPAPKEKGNVSKKRHKVNTSNRN